MTGSHFSANSRIGIDFDNTLANYNHVFVSAAITRQLIGKEFSGAKKELRDVIRRGVDGETEWMRLQGQVYGAHMPEATLFDGAADFLRRCKAVGTEVFIVSHKTEHGHYDPKRVNLREVACRWMDTHGFFDEGDCAISPGNIYFESSRAEKIARIDVLNLELFVDDLEEVFHDREFPRDIDRMLFCPGESSVPKGPFRVFRSWPEIAHDVFGTP